MTSYKQEIGRKAIHLGSAVFPIAYWFIPKHVFLPIIIVLGLGTFLVDYGRHHFQWLNRLFNTIFGYVLRENEDKTLTGGSSVMLSQIIIVVIFPKPIAIAALLTLSIGDSAAALVGKGIGRHIIYQGKTWEGAFAFLIAATIIAALVPGIPLYAAFFASLFAAIIEVYVDILDDNILIPVASGLCLFLILAV